MQPRPPWIGQLLRFGLVAPVVFVVDWTALKALLNLGAGPYAGRLGSLAVSVAVGFLLNRVFTFRAEGRPSWLEVRGYLAAAGLGIALNYGVFVVAVRLGLPHAGAIGAGMLAAAAVTFVRFRAVFGR
jgi:putative flippase GtrA